VTKKAITDIDKYYLGVTSHEQNYLENAEIKKL